MLENMKENLIPKIRGYYFITDKDFSKAGNYSDIKNAVKAGVSVFQYRNKTEDTAKLHEEALVLKKVCGKAVFLINDRIDVALAVDADGVHLGQNDMPFWAARKMLGENKIIGLTVHNVREAFDAVKMGADYLGVSPIFQTKTKLDAGKPSGISLIREVRQITKKPIIAIGGINLKNAAEVVGVGADGLCAISAVVASRSVKKEIQKFQKLFRI